MAEGEITSSVSRPRSLICFLNLLRHRHLGFDAQFLELSEEIFGLQGQLRRMHARLNAALGQPDGGDGENNIRASITLNR